MTAVELPAVPLLERPPVDWERHRGDGRPKILPPPGATWRNGSGRKIGHRYYTRVTTYADALTEQHNLAAWKLRRLALGLGQRSDYVRLAASYTADDRDRDALDELVGKALEAAGPNAADLGTALHSLFERVDRGEELGTPPEEVLPDVAAYVAVTDGTLRHAYREPRTVCDALECGGTPDMISHVLVEPCPAGCGPEVLHIGDSKTGSIRYPGKMAVQLAIYSRSDLYDPGTGERTPLEVCPRWGFIVHSPVETGEAALFWLDLDHGWAGAQLCGPVRSWRAAKADDILRPFATVAPVKVVDGEVTRVEPRLASTNLKAPAPIVDVTAQLAEVVASVPGPVELVESEDAADLDGTDDPEAAVDGPPLAEPQPEPIVEQYEAPTTLDPARCAQLDLALDPGARQCERPAGHPGACEFPGAVTPVERCPRSELQIGECACGDCRPDLAAVGDEGVERDEPLTEIPAEEVAAQAVRDEVYAMSRPVVLNGPWSGEYAGTPLTAWPGVDDEPVREDEHDPSDPLVDEIVRCYTTRDLELLSSRRWPEWAPHHKALAVARHDELTAAESAARPVAAFEAALATASTRGDVEAAVEAAVGQLWLDARLLDEAERRWHEVPR